jgi:hypothetical protein
VGWRDYAKLVEGAGHNRHIRHKSPENGPIVPTVPNVPAVPRLSPDRLLKSWWSALGQVDSAKPPDGFDPHRWAALCRCSIWWLGEHAQQAARDGWDTGTIFGLHKAGPRRGGLIDQFSAGLCHMRDDPDLVMDADRARWQTLGVHWTYGRGTGEGLLPFWEWRGSV